MIRYAFALAACLLAFNAQAQSVYKCSHEGKTSYGDRPCAHGSSRALPPPPSGVQPTDVVQTGDSRTLLELDKLRSERLKREAREEREQAKAGKLALARRQKCDKLRLRVKWAEEDAARATGNAREAAQRKARRQAQAMAVECRA